MANKDEYIAHKNSYTNRCLFKYVQPSNSHLRFLSLHIARICFVFIFSVFCVFRDYS